MWWAYAVQSLIFSWLMYGYRIVTRYKHVNALDNFSEEQFADVVVRNALYRTVKLQNSAELVMCAKLSLALILFRAKSLRAYTVYVAWMFFKAVNSFAYSYRSGSWYTWQNTLASYQQYICPANSILRCIYIAFMLLAFMKIVEFNHMNKLRYKLAFCGACMKLIYVGIYV